MPSVALRRLSHICAAKSDNSPIGGILLEYQLPVLICENLQRVAVADNIVRFRGIDEHFQLFRRPVSRFLNNDSVFRQLVGVAYTAAQKCLNIALELHLNGVVKYRDALDNEV